MSALLSPDRLAMTLVHFLWQGTLIALLAWALMALARRATWRYAIGCGAMLAMLLTTIVTFNQLSTPAVIAVPAAPQMLPQTRLAVPAVNARPAAAVTAAPVVSTADRLRAATRAASPLIVGGWLAGVALLVVRHLVGLGSIVRIRRAAQAKVDDALRARLARVATRLRLRRTVSLLGSTAVDAPCVVGVLRPAILWPVAMLAGLSPLQLDAILAHELAHVRRHDYLVNLLQTVIETLGFYHPAVWWLSRRVRQEREHCCDDVAAEVIGDRVRYAESLAAIESRRQPTTLGLAATGGSLVQRVRRLLVPTPPPHVSFIGRPVMLLLTCGLLVACVGLLRADRSASAITKPTVEGAVSNPPTSGAVATRSTTRASTAEDDAEHRRFAVLAEREPFFGMLLKQRDGVALDLAKLEAVQGPNSPLARNLQDRLDAANRQIEQIANRLDHDLPARPATQPAGDYRITGGDLLRVTINDLEGPNAKTVLIKRVANSGGIDLPYFKMPCMVAGQTEAEARATIMAAYVKAKVLSEPIVDVLVVEGSDGKKVPAELLASPAPAPPPTVAQLKVDAARKDLVRLLEERSKRQMELLEMIARYGATDSNVVARRSAVEEIEASIAQVSAFIENGGAAASPENAWAAAFGDGAPAVKPATTAPAKPASATTTPAEPAAARHTGTYYYSSAANGSGKAELTGQPLSLLQACIDLGLQPNEEMWVSIIRRGEPKILASQNFRVQANTGAGSEIEIQAGDTLIIKPVEQQSALPGRGRKR